MQVLTYESGKCPTVTEADKPGVSDRLDGLEARATC